MRTFVLTALALFLSCAAALAQAGKTTIGLGVGTGIGLTESLKDTTDSDLALQGHLTLGLAGALAVRGELGQTRFKPTGEFDILCADCALKINHLSLGLQYGGYGRNLGGLLTCVSPASSLP